MRKNFLFCLLLVMLVTGGVFAQEKAANAKSNWISGELSIFGGGARYERMLNDNISIGANIYWSSLIFFSEFGIDGSLRFYPWGKTFYTGIGLGFHTHTSISDEKNAYGYVYSTLIQINGIAFTPEIGWKIDVGDAGGFYLQPGAKLPITLGTKTGGVDNGKFDVGVGFVAYIGLGFAF